MKSPPVPLPADIPEFVKQLVDDERASEEIMVVVTEFHLRTRGLNVPPSQFCRAIICLCRGNVAEFHRLASIPEDPRDTLMRARHALGIHELDFGKPFTSTVLTAACRGMLEKRHP
jgi:hypothetical protein